METLTYNHYLGWKQGVTLQCHMMTTDTQEAVCCSSSLTRRSTFPPLFFSLSLSVQDWLLFSNSILSKYKWVDLELKATCNWFFILIKPFEYNYTDDWIDEQLHGSRIQVVWCFDRHQRAKGDQRDICSSLNTDFYQAKQNTFPEPIPEALTSAQRTVTGRWGWVYSSSEGRRCARGGLAAGGSRL